MQKSKFDNPLTHSDAISQLTNCKNNFFLGLFALNYFTSIDEIKSHIGSSCSFGRYTFDFAQIVKMLESNADIACKEFLKLHLRALIKESFEVVSQYTKNVDMYDVMKDQEWFHFARVIRNAIAHSGYLQIEQNKSYKWSGFELTCSDNEKPLSIDFIGYEGAYFLYEEIYGFLAGIHK
jgi:hypothetical protein